MGSQLEKTDQFSKWINSETLEGDRFRKNSPFCPKVPYAELAENRTTNLI